MWTQDSEGETRKGLFEKALTDLWPLTAVPYRCRQQSSCSGRYVKRRFLFWETIILGFFGVGEDASPLEGDAKPLPLCRIYAISDVRPHL